MFETASTSRGACVQPDGSADRGWLACEVQLPLTAPAPLLAVGAESKGVFCIAAGDRAWVSCDHGVLTAPDNYRAYRTAIARAIEELGVMPAAVVCDLHPAYVSTGYAKASGRPCRAVQHHHAHLAACLADNGTTQRVVGICGDGAGCGEDKASWGCEVMVANPASYRRAAHLRYLGLPGGDASAQQCWRPAWSLARCAYGEDMPAAAQARFAHVAAEELRCASRMLDRNWRAPQTSSLGRLFDAMAFLLGVCRENRTEAEAAIALQRAAEAGGAGHARAMPVADVGGVEVFDPAPMIRAVLNEQDAGAEVEQLAADFHESVAAALAQAAERTARREDLSVVALSGGCMFNGLLRERLKVHLADAGLGVLEHRQTLCSDAGLALGQVLVGIAREREQKG